ncbi:MAG TPA: hypothetical protein VLV50_00510 [Stellaceae bacterium]|nr:hypothetical protein [Stellaceae bacterium]
MTIGDSRAQSKSYDSLAEWLLLLPFLAMIFIAKFGIPVSSSRHIAATLPLLFICVVAAVALGRMEINTVNTGAYALTFFVLIMLQVVSGNIQGAAFSIKSLALLTVFHGPYCFSMRPGMLRPNIQLIYYQRIAVIIALCGVAQFVAQFVIGPDLAFPIENYAAQGAQMENYNNVIPLYTGAHYFKSNGIFLLEPSFFSMLVCIGVVIELVYFRRWVVVGILLLGEAVSYSGSGLAILCLCLPLYLVAQRRIWTLVLGVFGLGIAYFIATDVLGFDLFVNRAAELTGRSQETSGYVRFIAPWIVLDEWIWPSLKNALLGVGSGTYMPFVRRSVVMAWGPTWAKMIFEYGLLGTLIYFIFLVRCMWASDVSGYVKWALLLQITILGGNMVTQPQEMIMYLLIFPTAVAIRRPRTAAADAPAGEAPAFAARRSTLEPT